MTNIKSIQGELEPEELELGDCGLNVAHLQTKLTFFNYYQGEITGQFDLLTKQALQKFQTDNELSENGYFGVETWYSMTFWKAEEHFPCLDAIVSKIMSLGRFLRAIPRAKQTCPPKKILTQTERVEPYQDLS